MTRQEIGLRNIAGGAAAAPVLQHVTAQCRLDGLLLDSTVRQAYRNTSKDVLEVVYTFPMAPGAVLLGFSVTLAGRRQVGAIVEKVQAQQRYEEAMESGDAPILLERSGDVDLVLLDLAMPGARGFSGLMYMRAQYPGVPVIVVSAKCDIHHIFN